MNKSRLHLGLALVASLFIRTGGDAALAQTAPSPEPVTEQPDPPPADYQPPPAPHDPFERHPADLSPLTWSEMTEQERDTDDDLRAWADSMAPDVSQAYSNATSRTQSVSALRAAQRAAGLEGIEMLGVVP